MMNSGFDIKNRIKEILKAEEEAMDVTTAVSAMLIEKQVAKIEQELQTYIQQENEDYINKFETILGYFEALCKGYDIKDINGVNVESLTSECNEFIEQYKAKKGQANE